MIRRLLDIDGPFLGTMDKIGQLIVLSGLWLIGCIPLVTICTSNSALYSAVYRCVRKGEGSAVKQFWKIYKFNLLRGSAITVLLGAAAAVVQMGYYFLQGSGYPIGALGLGMLFLIFIFLYAGPVLSRFDFGIVKSFKLCFLLSMQFAHYTLVFFLGFLLIAFLQFFVLPVGLIFVLPGVWTLVTTFLMEKALERYMPADMVDGSEFES